MGLETMQVNDLSVKMTGKEKYKILGTEEELELSIFHGLALTGDCVNKALRAMSMPLLREATFVLGSVRVFGENGNSFAFEYHPPLECHAWLELEEEIVDLSFPGVVTMANEYTDFHGNLGINRPVGVIIKKCPDWAVYTFHHKFKYYEMDKCLAFLKSF